MSLEQAIAEAKRTGNYQPVVSAIPYNAFLGLRLERTELGPLCVLPPDPKLIGNPLLPALHGGVVGALLESAAILQLMWAHETVHVPKTIGISVDYLRSAGPRDTYAQGIVTKHGRRVANVRVEAWQDDRNRLIAAAHANFLLT